MHPLRNVLERVGLLKPLIVTSLFDNPPLQSPGFELVPRRLLPLKK